MCYNVSMDTAYDINPLDANVVFQIGQPIVAILIGFTLIAGLLGFIGRLASLMTLDVQGEKWMSRFLVALLYTTLFWLGLSMMISYFGVSVLDVINGAILLVGAATSLIQRATSNQQGANRTLAFTYGFLAFVFLWYFIYGSIMHDLPGQFLTAIGNNIHPKFFTSLFKVWGWG